MEKVQLGTRIPKDLDTEIESAARHQRMKKQEFIVQLLRHGLVAVGNLQNFPQKDQFNESQANAGNLHPASNPLPNTKSASAAQLFSNTSDFGKRLTCVESSQADFSYRLTEMTKILIELQSAISRSSADPANASSQTQRANMLSPTSTQEQVKQKSAAQAVSLHEGILVSSVNFQLPERQTEDKCSTEQVEQIQSRQLTFNANQEVELELDNQSEVSLLQNSSNSLVVQSEPKQRVDRTVEETPWLTIKEAYELAKAVGYQKSYPNFRVAMLESPNAAAYRTKWGFEFDMDRRQSPATKTRSIRLREDGSIAQALQALSEDRSIINVFADESSIVSDNPICSTCDKRMSKHSSYKGRQRYRCNQCRQSILKPKPEVS